VCCDQECDDVCESCVHTDTGVADGYCAPNRDGLDLEGECAAGACVDAGACCGDAVMPPGGTCPAVCTGGCSDGTCTIDCSAGDTCDGLPVACPAGFHCVVDCSQSQNACRDSPIDCPADHSCDVLCGNGEHKCQNAQITCRDGPCNVVCEGGDTCDGAVVTCGANSCEVQCAAKDKPAVTCGDSCSCPDDCSI
jgi:hypothetical protein